MNKNVVAVFRWKVLAGDMELNKGMSCQMALIFTVKTESYLWMRGMKVYYKLRI